MRIQKFRQHDAKGVIRLFRSLEPTWHSREEDLSAPTTRHARRWVALLDSELAGYTEAEVARGARSVWFWLGVDPGCRRQGIGTALFRLVERLSQRYSSPKLSTSTTDDLGRAFLEAREFRMKLTELYWDVTPSQRHSDNLEVLMARSTDVRIQSLESVHDQLADLYPFIAEMRTKHRRSRELSFDDWKRTLNELELSGSFLAFEGARPYAACFVLRPEGHRASIGMEAHEPLLTDIELRGIAHLGTLAWAYEKGIEELRVSKLRSLDWFDSHSQEVLLSLGFEHSLTRWHYSRP